MLVRSAFVTALLLAPVTEPVPRGVELRFAPEAGLALRKSFQRSDTSETRTVSNTVDGEERGNDSTQSGESETSLVLVDRYVERDDERVLVLERSFEEYRAESEMGYESAGETQEMVSSATNELNELTVRFTWDADEEDYVARCEEAEDEWLEALAFDHDLTAMLPDGPVELGDEWTITPERARTLTRFDQDLPLEREVVLDGETVEMRERHEEDEGEPSEREEEKEDSGELTARFDGMREVDGREFAVIVLEGELTTRSRMQSTTAHDHGSTASKYDMTNAVEIRGECLWDVAGGHLHSFTAKLEQSGTTRNETTVEMEEHGFEMTQESESEGTSTLEVTFERVD